MNASHFGRQTCGPLVIVLPVGQVKMGAMAYGGVVDPPDLKKVVPVLGGLTKSIMWNALFLPEIVQLR